MEADTTDDLMAAEDTVKRGFFSAGRVPLKKNRSTKDYDLLHFNKRRDGVYASESTKDSKKTQMSTVGVDLGVWKYTQNRTLSHRISHVGFCRTGRLLCHSPVFPIQAVSLSRPLERQRRRRRHKRIGIVASKHSGESARRHRHISRFSHRREEKRCLNVNLVVSSDQIQEGELIDKSNADVLKGWYYPEVSPLPVFISHDLVG
ncbi:uncharacterized protein [Oscarella lobularis]|uniref:uncharacterized protein isoform X2 n=1 Tax=Oscarella lobularis TaxID=121494 RepID=UPI00331390E6